MLATVVGGNVQRGRCSTVQRGRARLVGHRSSRRIARVWDVPLQLPARGRIRRREPAACECVTRGATLASHRCRAASRQPGAGDLVRAAGQACARSRRLTTAGAKTASEAVRSCACRNPSTPVLLVRRGLRREAWRRARATPVSTWTICRYLAHEGTAALHEGCVRLTPGAAEIAAEVWSTFGRRGSCAR